MNLEVTQASESMHWRLLADGGAIAGVVSVTDGGSGAV